MRRLRIQRAPASGLVAQDGAVSGTVDRQCCLNERSDSTIWPQRWQVRKKGVLFRTNQKWAIC
jgi:hypothetical protein